MIIKYFISYIIFKIIYYLPKSKLCNILNYYLVVYIGSNHIRRLWNLKKIIKNKNLYEHEKIIYKKKNSSKINVFIGDSHAEFYGRNFESTKLNETFFTYHTGPTLLTTFATSRELILKIYNFIVYLKKNTQKKIKINIIFSFGEIDIRTFFYQTFYLDKNFNNEESFIKFIANSFEDNLNSLSLMFKEKKLRNINLFFKEMTPQTYLKNYRPKNIKEFEKIRATNPFPVIGKLNDRIRWSNKLSKNIEKKCNNMEIKFLKLSKENYGKSGSINPKFTIDDRHITEIKLLQNIQKKIF